jgi:hypothetical protein
MLKTETPLTLCDSAPGYRRRLHKTQPECLEGREKKVTDLLPFRYADIPFSKSIGLRPDAT